MTWTKSHPEKRNEIKEDSMRNEWGNNLADRMAGVSELTNGWTVHFEVVARDALLSFLSPHQCYIGDPNGGPALTIGVEVKA